MKGMFRRITLLFGLLALGVVIAPGAARPATAASTPQAIACPDLYKAAVQAAAEHCAGLGRNQLCLASGSAVLQAQPGFEGAAFSQPGDIIDASAIASLTTSSTQDSFALAVMRLQLNQSVEAAENNTTVILVGGIDLRADLENIPTWAISPVETMIETQAGKEVLETVVPPLAAFDFTSTESVCGGELPNGLLIQSPTVAPGEKFFAETLFNANGLNFALGSTVFANAGADGVMHVDVLEHYASVSNEDGSITVLAGEGIDVPLDGPWVSDADGTIIVRGPESAGDVGVLDYLADLLGDEGLATRTPPPPPPTRPPYNRAGGYTKEHKLDANAPWLYVVGSTTFAGTCPVKQSLFPESADYVNIDDHLVMDSTGAITGFVWANTDSITLGGASSVPMDEIAANVYMGSEEMAIVRTVFLVEKLSPFSILGTITGVIDDGVLLCVINTPIYFNSCLLDVFYGTTDGSGFCESEIHQAMGTR